MSLLTVERLRKSYGGVAAVTDVSFAVPAGAVHSVIGPNGAGKTTLFNLVSGLDAPSAGRILFDGADMTAEPAHRRAARGIARSFQNLQIFDNLSALENVMVGRHRHEDRRLLPALLRLPGAVRAERAAAARAAELMRFVGLDRFEGAAPSALPYGALKRLEIARALALEPTLLLLDEPAAGCNPVETREIALLIRAIAAQGIAVLLVEHDMRLVMDISDRLLVLERGRVLAEGVPAAIRDDPAVIEAYLGVETGEASGDAA